MTHETPASVSVTASQHFSTHLLNEFHEVSGFKINRLFEQQTDEEMWMTLSIPIKVKYIIYLAYKKSGHRSQSENKILLNVLSWSANEIESKWQQITPTLLDYIENALQLRSVLQSFPALSFIISFTTFSQTAIFINEPRTQDRVKLYALSQTLDQWVNWEKIKKNPPSASEAVLAVLHHYHSDFSLTELLQIYDGKYQSCLYEAILLYQWSRNNVLLSDIVLPEFRDKFIVIIKSEEKDKQILDQMFFDKKNDPTAIVFDGFAFKNAIGKTFSHLLNCRELTPLSAFYVLSETERCRLLEKKLLAIGESQQYKIGTVQHSLASVLIRINQYQNKTVNNDWQDDLILLQEFKKIVKAWSENKNYPLHPFLLFALHLNKSCGIQVKQTTKILLKNASERLLACYGVAPHFDLRQATTEILGEYGMVPAEMEQIHDYIILRQHLILLPSPEVATGDYYHEFWDRARRENDWINRYFILNSRLINAPARLNEKWRLYIESLPHNPWIQAKAKENLIMAKATLNQQKIAEEIQKIVTQCMNNQCRLNIAPIAQFALVEVCEELINLIPFVGSIYNMEEGIRHHDWLQAVLGAISLGIDSACLVYRGVKNGVNAAKMNISSLPKNDQKIIKTLGQVTEQTSDISATHWTNNIDAITIDPDPYNVALHDAPIPAEFREHAEQVREDNRNKQWKGYPLVYVIDQDRVVPIKSSGGGFFYEVDWRTEKPNYGKMIMREAGEKYYTKVGLKGGSRARKKVGLKCDGIPINWEQEAFLDIWYQYLTDSITLDTLSNFLPEATNTLIRPNFDELFLGKFILALERGQSPAITISTYKNMYQCSPTFRRLFNYATSIPGNKYRIKITETISPQVNMGKNQIKLPGESTLSLVGQYINLFGDSVKYSAERIYLHEMLHALSNLLDPAIGISSVFNRGPIIYLTERILFESGHISPGRLCYHIDFTDEAESAAVSESHLAQEETDMMLQIPGGRGRPMSPADSEKSGLSNNLPWYTDPNTISAVDDGRKISLSSSNYSIASSNSSVPIQLERLLALNYFPPEQLKRSDIRMLVVKKIIAEDFALDLELANDIDNSTFEPTADTIILGEKLGEQNTVVNVIKYRNSLHNPHNLFIPTAGENFHQLFKNNLASINSESLTSLVKISRNCLFCEPQDINNKVKNILESCYNASPTFGRLLIHRKSLLPTNSYEIKWDFILNQEHNEDYLTNKVPCFRINNDTHTITLWHHKAFAYLGETGIQRLSLERQTISAMVEMCLRDTRFPASTLNADDVERGISVYLSNLIMHETGYRQPIQLTRDLLPLYVLTGKKGEKLLQKLKNDWEGAYKIRIKTITDQMLDQQNILLSKTTNARRLAEIQDRYLATLAAPL